MNKSLPSHCHARAEIDLDALAFNLMQVRGLVGKEKKILAVVKANAYGHGAAHIARTLEALGTDWFGVACLDEGIHLRESGVKKPILILGGISPLHIESAYASNLTPVIYDYKSAFLINALGEKQKKTLPVHIKIDTGMNRLGVPYEEAADFFSRLRDFGHLEIEGVLSHLSSAHLSDRNSQEFSDLQRERLKRILEILKQYAITPSLIHMANSSAIMKGMVTESNTVRAGLMLYGAYPSRDLEKTIALRPVMTLKTTIMQLKSLPVTSPISYSRTFHTTRQSRIAILAIGYGDGYHYRLSNRGRVIVHGHEAPVLGSVCMDLTMVDVTDIPEAREKDEVVLFGQQGGTGISVEEVAEWAGSIPYEILCGISSRVPRLYVKEQSLLDVG
jgi:alanine racemase